MKKYERYATKSIGLCQHNAPTALAAALGLALAAISGGGNAATKVVTNCNDSGSGSMRAAISAAVSGDVVDASGLQCSKISLSTGALAISVDNLTVIGAGREHLTIINGAKYGRVLRHTGTGLLLLKGMTISSGYVSLAAPESDTRGGCIYSAGAVTLGNFFDSTDKASGVDVTDCNAVSKQAGVLAQGGGIYAKTGVALANSTVTHSNAVAQSSATNSYGGGIALFGGALSMKYSEVSNCAAKGLNGFGGGIQAGFVDTVTVKHSTIAGNSASGKAGGAYLGSYTGGQVLIENSTISGNTAAFDGGMLVNVASSSPAGLIKMYASTITNNNATNSTAATGGVDFAGPTQIESTIAAGNFVAGVQANVLFFTTPSGSNNLVGTTFDKPSGSNWIVAADPKLGPLANHGGTTRTHLPLANSPVINAGNNSSNATADQRGSGFPRIIGSAPDIGATEFDPDRIFNNGFD